MHKVVRRESNERKMPNDWLMKVPRIGVPLADKAEGKKGKETNTKIQNLVATKEKTEYRR